MKKKSKAENYDDEKKFEKEEVVNDVFQCHDYDNCILGQNGRILTFLRTDLVSSVCNLIAVNILPY